MPHAKPEERIQWLHSQIKKGRYPNKNKLMARFGIQAHTVKRDKQRLRDAGAPIAHDRENGGWRYTDPDWELPQIPVQPDELLAIVTARQLLADTAGGYFSRLIRRFDAKLMANARACGLDKSRMADCVSACRHGHRPVSAETFRKVFTALTRGHVLEIGYHSPSSGVTRRTVEPGHLRYYMGSWTLFAWCRLRRGWRIFFLARMRSCRMKQERFALRPMDEWKASLDGGFGLYFGESHETAVLRFAPERADLVREQRWHPAQQMEDLPDGGMRLSLPVADFAEIKAMILGFGAEVRVEAPDRLRREVAEEIGKMAELYRESAKVEDLKS